MPGAAGTTPSRRTSYSTADAAMADVCFAGDAGRSRCPESSTVMPGDAHHSATTSSRGPAIAQLVAYNLTGIDVKFSFGGPARLHLVPHVNAPVADLPVVKMVGGRHFKADLTLPYGRVLHDYLASAVPPGTPKRKPAA